MTCVYIKFFYEPGEEVFPPEPVRFHRIIHDNIAWPELDSRPNCWRSRIAHCWLDKEYPNSLNLEIELGDESDEERIAEELELLAAAFPGKTEAKRFMPRNSEMGPEVKHRALNNAILVFRGRDRSSAA